MLFVDSICIKFLSDGSTLYGKGNRLFLRKPDHRFRPESKSDDEKFFKSSDDIENDTKTFDKIHIISILNTYPNSYRVACAAGREILITSVTSSEFTETSVIKVTDWISSIKLLSRDTLVAVTSHNIALLIQISSNPAVIKEKLRCDESSTLYCSHIHGEAWENLLFLGGTALGELVVWRRLDEGVSKILHRQFLHNGVIFSIDINGKYLTTSSDDRSIKIFNLTQNPQNSFALSEVKQLFGHTSRVFSCRIISHKDRTLFLSAGEDSSICVWTIDGQLLFKRNVCNSGILWNLDYSEKFQTIVTCSSTGRLNRFFLPDVLSEKHSTESVTSSGATPAKLCFLENGTLVVLDSEMEIHSKFGEIWTKIDKPQSDQKFVAMEALENRLFLAGKSSIFIFDFDENEKILKLTKQIQLEELLELDYLRSIHALALSEVLVCDLNGSACIIDVEREKVLSLLRIPKSSEPWTTSALKVEGFLLVGDRVGNLFLYEVGNLSQNQQKNCDFTNPLQEIPKLHGNLGVTTIRLTPEKFITTTGNDGTIKTLHLDTSHTPPTLEIYRSERSLVNWIEKVCKIDGRELLLGFNDNYFVINHNRQIIYEHKCGGRHRHWDVTLKDDCKVRFAYIQKKKLNFVDFTLCLDESDGNVTWHIKECNVIDAFDDVLVSGGEDTLLKVMRMEMAEGRMEFKELATVNSHISSVKAIAMCKEGPDLLIFSAGGRAQIVVTRLMNFQHVKEEVNFLLMKSNSCFNPETRFTSIAFDSNQLFVGCSDGFIRIFRYTKGCLEPTVEHFYGKCLLRIHFLEGFVLSMATDGLVTFWKPNSTTLSMKAKIKHNKSGINCFDIVKTSERTFRIATSGDDAGVYITDFEITHDGDSINFLQTMSCTDVHIAQVTGLKFASKDILLSTGVDQQICKLRVDDEGLIEILDKTSTCISDVKGFVVSPGRVIVYGAGLEVIENFS